MLYVLCIFLPLIGAAIAGLLGPWIKGRGAMIVTCGALLISAALFLCVGVIYDRIHTREIARYGGLAEHMPVYAVTFMVFMLASVGLPGTSGFVGEFLVLVGLFQVNTWVATLATTGIVLGAAYMLYLYRRVIFGKLTKDDLKSILDMNPREIAVFAPLIILTIVMGIYPGPFLDIMEVSVANLVDQHKAAMASLQAVSVAGR